MANSRFKAVLRLMLRKNALKFTFMIFGSYLAGQILNGSIMMLAKPDTYINLPSLLTIMFTMFFILFNTAAEVTGSFRNMIRFGVTRRNFLLAFTLEYAVLLLYVLCAAALLYALDSWLTPLLYAFARPEQFLDLTKPAMAGSFALITASLVPLGFLAGLVIVRFGYIAVSVVYFGFAIALPLSVRLLNKIQFQTSYLIVLAVSAFVVLLALAAAAGFGIRKSDLKL